MEDEAQTSSKIAVNLDYRRIGHMRIKFYIKLKKIKHYAIFLVAMVELDH